MVPVIQGGLDGLHQRFNGLGMVVWIKGKIAVDFQVKPMGGGGPRLSALIITVYWLLRAHRADQFHITLSKLIGSSPR